MHLPRGTIAALAVASLVGTARAEERPRFRIDLGGTFDKFTLTPENRNAGYTHYRDQEGGGFVELGYRATDSVTVIGGYDVQHQLDVIDHRFNAGVYWAALPRLTLFARGATAPNAAILPRWEAQGEADVQVLDALAITAMVRHLDYHAQTINRADIPADGVTIFAPGVRLNVIPRTTLFAQGGVATHTSTPTTGYLSGRAEVEALDRLVLSAGLTRGSESRRPFNPQSVSTTTVVTGGVRFAFSASTSARLDYSHEEFEQEYSRNSLGSALTHRF